MVDKTDGVYNGNILEFKLTINNLNKTLLQAIKYILRMRIKGESVLAKILLVSLNDTTLYNYLQKTSATIVLRGAIVTDPGKLQFTKRTSETERHHRKNKLALWSE